MVADYMLSPKVSPR